MDLLGYFDTANVLRNYYLVDVAPFKRFSFYAWWGVQTKTEQWATFW
jgi:hypothetical protein